MVTYNYEVLVCHKVLVAMYDSGVNSRMKCSVGYGGFGGGEYAAVQCSLGPMSYRGGNKSFGRAVRGTSRDVYRGDSMLQSALLSGYDAKSRDDCGSGTCGTVNLSSMQSVSQAFGDKVRHMSSSCMQIRNDLANVLRKHNSDSIMQGYKVVDKVIDVASRFVSALCISWNQYKNDVFNCNRVYDITVVSGMIDGLRLACSAIDMSSDFTTIMSALQPGGSNDGMFKRTYEVFVERSDHVIGKLSMLASAMNIGVGDSVRLL